MIRGVLRIMIGPSKEASAMNVKTKLKAGYGFEIDPNS